MPPKHKICSMLLAGLVSILIYSLPLFAEPERNDLIASSENFAVVELFTSQMSSEANDAETVLSTVVSYTLNFDQPIFPLAFHVDYLNDRSGRDVFSDDNATKRQRDYIVALRQRNLDVPQMIINGNWSIDGKDQRRTDRYIDRALGDEAELVLELQIVKSGQFYTAYYRADSVPTGFPVIHIAVVERSLFTTITAGENKGKTLQNDNVVRNFQTALLENTNLNTLPIIVPDDIVLSNSSVIAYVQDLRSMEIYAAVMIEFDDIAQED